MLIIKKIIQLIIIYILIIIFIPNLWKIIDNKLKINLNHNIENTKNNISNSIFKIWINFKKWANNPTPKMKNHLNSEINDIKKIENN